MTTFLLIVSFCVLILTLFGLLVALDLVRRKKKKIRFIDAMDAVQKAKLEMRDEFRKKGDRNRWN